MIGWLLSEFGQWIMLGGGAVIAAVLARWRIRRGAVRGERARVALDAGRARVETMKKAQGDMADAGAQGVDDLASRLTDRRMPPR